MNFQQLNYVTQLYRYKSFNQAAKALFVSQPALSRAIKKLENELGIVIFHRSNTGITVTPEGEKFINSINSVMSQINQLTSVNLGLEDPMKTFRVTSTPSSFVAESFLKFCLMYQNIEAFRFRLNITELSKVIDDVFRNRADLGIAFLGTYYDELWKKVIIGKGLNYTRIGSLNLSVLISNKDPLAKHDSLELQQLKDYCFVRNHARDHDGTEELFLDVFNLIDSATQKKAIQSFDREITYQILSRTKSFTLAYNHHRDYAKRFDLTCIPLSSPIISTEIGFIYKNRNSLDEKVLKFMEIYQQELAAGVLSPTGEP